MLNDSVYAKRWEAKRRWYASHGVVEHPASGSQLLISTEDDPAGGIDGAKIAALIDQLFG